MPLRNDIGRASAALLALLGAGCADSALSPSPLTAALGEGALPLGPSADPPVEVYARVARGALKCWFGPDGSLKATHVFHAKVDPPSAGGAAEIGVHTREAGSNHGVLRAYGINISPSSGGSAIEVQNFRFPEKDAALMKADVARWVSGQEGCSIVGTGGWNAGPQPPATEPLKESVAAKGKEASTAKR